MSEFREYVKDISKDCEERNIVITEINYEEEYISGMEKMNWFEEDNVDLIWVEDIGFIYLNYNQDSFDTASDGDLDTLLQHLSKQALKKFLTEEL